MMAALSLKHIAAATGGQLRGSDCQINALSTDSRKIEKGNAYLALCGDRFDGHDFAAEAVAKGAVAAIVSRPVGQDLPQVQVEDSLLALGQIAAINRKAFTGPVLALTGSCGKTSCKEMLAAILRCSHRVQATEGNLNNEIGVPLTLLSIGTEHDVAIVEMGAAKAGDIAYLCQFAQPDVALITNAAPAHLEGFGSLQAVADTKGEIYQSLHKSGTAIINGDDAFAEQWRARTAAQRVLSISRHNSECDFFARDIHITGKGTRFTLRGPDGEIAVTLPVLGVAMVSNALLAAAAAWAVGASFEDIANGLASVRAVKGRLYLQSFPELNLIDDSYNANPASVTAAIDVLSAFSGRRILVLGDMAELGEQTQRLHEDIGSYAARQGIDRVLTCGSLSEFSAQAAGSIASHFSDKSTLIAQLQSLLRPGDSVLVKGSRSAGMEEVVSAVANIQVTGGNTPC
ncbi:MAG TPA: UDP-N-acetylmuramoyl-tripeptide--D-alanyl-D-alanine ligase [Spongiibacteraceae bacterium]|mgnify:CR=1 FL=1|nr:UDP-N-acetylmuramoyl-tripeptide--D-alanyl-D-alanine ligase [Spongiibacteraceae bacterium]HCS28155.1 UDP-N-acetylmuramoyl-tripeptide--D-alanyl-D-alanine ligase [Spongiibacteraceae bacterium]